MKKIKLFLAFVLLAAALTTLGAEKDASTPNDKDSALVMALVMFSPSQLLACYQYQPSLQADIEEIWRAEPKSIVPSGPGRDFFLACAAKVELMSAQQCLQLINLFQSMKNKEGKVPVPQVQAYLDLTKEFVGKFKTAEIKEDVCARPQSLSIK